MANRYYTTDELLAMGAGVYHKPYGTLGSHVFFIKTVTPQGVEVVGLPGGESNPVDFSIADVPEGWTLGYNCGAVWAIRPARLIANPLRRVLREHQLSWNIVERTGEPVQITTAFHGRGAHYRSYDVGEWAHWLGEQPTSQKEVGYSVRGPWDGSEPSNSENTDEYHGGEVAVVTSSRMTGPNDSMSQMSRIVIRPGVSDARAAELLRSYWEK